MSILSSGYSSYLSHFHKFEQRIGTFNYAFNHVFDLAKQGIYIDCGIEDRMNHYPKYPCFYRFIDRLSSYNLLKIHHASLDTIDKLTSYITSKNALELKPSLERIPTDLEKIRNDIYLQYTFFSTIDDIFNLKQHFHDYSHLKKIINYSYALYDEPYNENHEDHSFIHLFLFDFMFRQQLKNSANFNSSLNVYCLEHDIFSVDDISQEFTDFIDKNKTEFLNSIVEVIIQSLYRMSNTDQDLIDNIVKSVKDNIDSLTSAFDLYISMSTIEPATELIKYCLNSLYLVLGTKTMDDIFDNSNIFNQEFIQSVSSDEEIIFNNFIADVSNSNIKSYLYLSYLYKFWPIKFLNIYPFIIDKYVQDVIKTENDLAYSQRNLETILKSCIADGNVDYTELKDYLESNITHGYIHQLAQDEKVTQFGCFVYFIKLFDNFMNSDPYNQFVDDIYKSTFLILRDKGYIEHDFNWCKCKELFNLFFKSFIRVNITNRSVFKDVCDEFETVFLDIINNNTGNSKYDVNISFSEAKLRSVYNSIVISHFDKIHGFIESMYLSKVSDIVNYNMMSYFLVDQS